MLCLPIHVRFVPITDIAEASSDSHAPAGAETVPKLTLPPDHSLGADHSRPYLIQPSTRALSLASLTA